MSAIAFEIITGAILTLLTEAYAGPPDPTTTWFIDNQPDSGIFGILAGITAEEASLSVDGSGRPGTTIAANVEHLRWSLANANAALSGQPYQANWQESWKTTIISAGEWDQLRQTLQAEFGILRHSIQQQTALPGEYLTGVLALIPHAAYHLGTLRQMVERVRTS